MDIFWLFAIAVISCALVGFALGGLLLFAILSRYLSLAVAPAGALEPFGEVVVPFSPGSPIIGHAQGRFDDNQQAAEPLGGDLGTLQARTASSSEPVTKRPGCRPCAKIRESAKKLFIWK